MKGIMAADQSTSATGLAYFINGDLVDYWLIKPKSSKRATETAIQREPHLITITMPEADYDTTLLRTTVITDEVERLIEELQPDELWFEEIFENGNPKGYRSLARLQGFLAHVAHKHNVAYTIVEETRWISSWGKYDKTVKRPERKADIMAKVNALYGLDINVNDITDAIAIGRYASEVKEN